MTAQVKNCIILSFTSARLQTKKELLLSCCQIRLLIEAAASEFQGNVQRKGTTFFFKIGQCLFFLHGKICSFVSFCFKVSLFRIILFYRERSLFSPLKIFRYLMSQFLFFEDLSMVALCPLWFNQFQKRLSGGQASKQQLRSVPGENLIGLTFASTLPCTSFAWR